MKQSEIVELNKGFSTAFIDSSHQSNLAFRPEFLSNDHTKGRKVLSSIEQELMNCDEFLISVAFITKSGITPLLQVLKDLEKKAIPGKVLTTDYLLFSEPEALEKLASLSNIELRMFQTSGETGGFHTKGYVFRTEEVYRIIIGSSNMTLNAITKNREWNTKIVGFSDGELTQSVLEEFNSLWNSPNTKSIDSVIEQYRIVYTQQKLIRDQRRLASESDIVEIDSFKLTPNKMQVEFVNSLKHLRSCSIEKALLLSATGTGKTFASAFAMRELGASKVLFVVHREQIAKQALKSYKRVFGSSKKYGLLSGNSKDLSSDYLFATMQMMSKTEILNQLAPERFDYIVLDECHHAGSDSYQKIMNHFKPKFWLGMTASPDTNQYDIYSLFDHNIAYEIRLQQALEGDFLCPFHYFGITDLEINGEVFDDNTGVRNFSRLVSDARVQYVIEKAEYFGFSGDRVKGLVFCSRKEEAKELSKKFNCYRKRNGQYYRTAVLTGEDNQSDRERTIDKLAGDNDADALDYIFTVDIFNEGVDIPDINQVIMLRPTQSPVVFIQQLGRGLRKAEGKEYVVILDFIGNYMNNFMIPIALSGDRSYNKDTIRRYVREGSRVIPGSSTIHFDEISKKRIYASIDAARTNDLKLIKDSYQSLKYKLGKIPSLLDFKKFGSIDVIKIFEKCGSYYTFLKKYERDYDMELNKTEEEIITFISSKLVLFKRSQDLILLHELINRPDHVIMDFAKILNNEYGLSISPQTERSVFANLSNVFAKTEERNKFSACVFIQKDGENGYTLNPAFLRMLDNKTFSEMVKELLTFGLDRYIDEYSDLYKDTSFQLYQKYTYEDVCRLLNWSKNLNAQNIGGYFYDTETKTLPVFINYEKADDAIAYEDRFITESHLIALSKHPRRVTSSDADHFYKRTKQDEDNRIYLFVRKNKDDREAKEFYFLGEIYAEGEPREIFMESTGDYAFEIDYRLDSPVRSDIFDYIVRD